MKNDDTKRCPYLKEVVMIFCEAYPVKKMVPLDRIKTTSRCFGDDFHGCALFHEVSARMNPPPSKRPLRTSGVQRLNGNH